MIKKRKSGQADFYNEKAKKCDFLEHLFDVFCYSLYIKKDFSSGLLFGILFFRRFKGCFSIFYNIQALYQLTY